MLVRAAFFSLIGAVVGLSLFPAQSDAQSLVKRVKCSEAELDVANDFYGVAVYRNISGSNRSIAVQVVRDGCRPKGDDGRFSVHETDFDGTTLFYNAITIREHNHTAANHFEVEDGRVGRLSFTSLNGAKVAGTFDYVLIVE